MSAAAGPMLAHSVFFTLKDKSPQAKQALVAACQKYLTGHAGTVFFAAGARAEEIDWSVSDRRFDVVLHLVFADKAAHDAYQDSPQHEQFLAEMQHNWSEIRAADAYVEGAAG
jgi:hypothetical protein